MVRALVIRAVKKILPAPLVGILRKFYHRASGKFKLTIPEEHRQPDAKYKYLCCEILYTHIDFEEDHFRPHCWRGSGDFLPKYAFNGEPLSKKKLINYLRHIITTLGREPEKCEGCIRAYYDKKPQKAFIRFMNLKLIMLNQHRFWCNVKCSYCFWLSRKEKGNIPKPYSIIKPIEFLLDAGMVNASCDFSWGGGESTILPEFDTLARLICDKGNKQILNTNSTVFSEAWAYVLSKDERTYCNVSVDSGTAETYRKIKGVDCFDQVWENIKKYVAVAKCKNSFKVKYIVMNCNRDHVELERFIHKCIEAGVQSIEYSVDGREIYSGVSEETVAAVAYLKALALKNNLIYENVVFWDPSIAKRLDNYPLPEIC